MPQIQLDFCRSLMQTSKEIAKQLAIANKLKIIELRDKIGGKFQPLDDLEAEIGFESHS